MQDAICFQNAKRLRERQPGMEPPPVSRASHPVDIELILPHAVDPGEGRIELLTAIMPCPTGNAA
jgi:hypothetical protein